MKKKNTFFLILFSIVFFICITSIGCFYDHNRSNSDSKTSEKTQKLIDNRPISSNEQINQNFGEMSIEINQGSCEEGHLSVSQTLVNDNEGSGFKIYTKGDPTGDSTEDVFTADDTENQYYYRFVVLMEK